MTSIVRGLRKPYVSAGIIFIIATLLLLSIDVRQLIENWMGSWYNWQIVTGLLLLGAFLYQWELLATRMSRSPAARPHYHWHRYVGVGMVVLFLLHAVSLGYAWTSWLALLFMANAALGLLNKEVVSYPARWIYLAWYGAHIAVSAVLVPLAALHIWVALAYE